MTLDELRPHLHSIPDQPDLIPYRTSYYRRRWGFCLPHRVLESLEDGIYRVKIDSTLEAGSLTYGELFIPGTEASEVLISTHCCHPSLADDNLSGVAVAVALARALLGEEHRYGYRFIFAPGTIGAIVWLARNRDRLDRIHHGLVMTCVGDHHPFTFKRSRRGDTPIDRAMAYVLSQRDDARLVDFVPYGYDERQYCSPGFDLPVGCLMRGRHGEFPEYHTSADDLDLVRPERLAESLELYLQLLDVLERDRLPVSTSPYGEPQLGRRGLYRSIGGAADGRARELPLLWVLSFADGRHSLLDIAERAGLPFDRISAAAEALLAAGLLEAER
jgi:aminopeptidase-like protein